MSLHAALAFAIAGIGATISLFAVIALAWRSRDEPATPWFIGTAALAAVWTAMVTVGLFIESTHVWWYLDLILWVGICVLPITWLGFVLVYTGRRHRTRSQYVFIVSVIPAVTLGVLSFELFTGGGLVRADLGLATVDGVSLPVVAVGTIGTIQITYSFFLLGLTLILLFEQLFSSHDIYRRQAGLLAIATMAPMTAAMVRPIGVEPFSSGSITGFSFIVSALVLVVALAKYDILQTRPVPFYLAHSTILESIDTPLVVANESDIIVHSNSAADELLGAGDDLRSHPIDELPGVSNSQASQLAVDDLIDVNAIEGQHIFAPRTATLADEHDREHGSVVWYQDFTGIRRREQRLNVLNRVLRHDIRNEMNVILGHAQTISTAEGTEAPLAAIKSTARSVVGLSETARDIERLINRASVIDPAGTVDEAIEAIQERMHEESPDGSLEVTVDCDPETIVPVGFREVLWQLVENGISHNESPSPSVDISITKSDDMLRCSVADDGPGIPESELAVFDSGEETSLDHASGLGLWMVHWVVNEFGGEVHVESTDDGTSVTVTLPTAE